MLGLTVADKLCKYLGSLHYVPRPFVALHFTPLFPHMDNNSFPSSTVAFAAVAAAVIFLPWRPVGSGWCVGTVIIAVGCVYVGVHYIEDVIVGAALGIVCGAVFWLALGPPPSAASFGRSRSDCQGPEARPPEPL